MPAFGEDNDTVDDSSPTPSLQQVQEFARFLRAVPILAELDESALWVLAQHAHERSFEPGASIVCEGDESTEFFIIRSGQADVYKHEFGGEPRRVARLACGSYFGELGLLTNSARSASVEVTVARPMVALVFDAQLFHEVIADHVLVFRLKRHNRQLRRKAPQRHLCLHEIGILQGLPPEDLEHVLNNSEEELVAAGDAIFWQGDLGDRFYVLLDGELDVERDDEIIATLKPGDFFGETALLFDSRRTATIRAWGDSRVWSITRAAFQKVVAHYLLRDQKLRPTVLARLQASPLSSDDAAA